MTGIEPKHLSVNLNYHNSHLMENYIVDASSVVDTSFNIIDRPSFLNGIICDVLFSGINTKKIELFDTSGIPTGSEEKKFNFLISSEFPQHNISFPKDGIYFKNGISMMCSDLGGGGSASFLNTNFLYTIK